MFVNPYLYFEILFPAPPESLAGPSEPLASTGALRTDPAMLAEELRGELFGRCLPGGADHA